MEFGLKVRRVLQMHTGCPTTTRIPTVRQFCQTFCSANIPHDSTKSYMQSVSRKIQYILIVVGANWTPGPSTKEAWLEKALVFGIRAKDQIARQLGLYTTMISPKEVWQNKWNKRWQHIGQWVIRAKDILVRAILNRTFCSITGRFCDYLSITSMYLIR